MMNFPNSLIKTELNDHQRRHALLLRPGEPVLAGRDRQGAQRHAVIGHPALAGDRGKAEAEIAQPSRTSDHAEFEIKINRIIK